MRARPDPFLLTAAIALGVLVFGSVLYWAIALSVGVLTGLVLLLGPAYPFLMSPVLAVFLTSLCWWRGWRWAGFGLGLVVLVAPAAVVSGVYAREWHACTVAADPDACFAYLNGSPVLPVGVAVVVLMAASGVVGLAVATRLLAPRG